jgi:rare lipoprotein A
VHPVRLAIAAIVVGLVAACGGPKSPQKKTKKPTPAKKQPGKPAPPIKAGIQHGLATWYGSEQHGGPTASGEKFNKHAMTAAHRTLPMGTQVRVTNKKNGRQVVVRINDRGPFGNASRIIDVSEAAARILGMIDAGVVPCVVEVLK